MIPMGILRSINDIHLISSAKRNSLSGVKNALKHGAHIDARDRDGVTAIMHAYSHYNHAIVEFLKSHDASFSEEDRIAAQMSASLNKACKLVTKHYGHGHARLTRA